MPPLYVWIILIYAILAFLAVMFTVDAMENEKKQDDYILHFILKTNSLNPIGKILALILNLPWMIIGSFCKLIELIFTWRPGKNTENKKSSGRHLKF